MSKDVRVSLKCFVASAFGRDDVDAIYDRVVVKVLKTLGVVPLRVDRQEHNDDIDDKILELLDAADFCITDLTYARPSAYYEAGYACGAKKPVVYISRRDHLSDKTGLRPDDKRIHFDLQMKNVVAWDRPNRDFTGRLRRRLEYVLRPILKSRSVEAAVHEQRKAFGRLPVGVRLSELQDQFVTMARKAGMMPWVTTLGDHKFVPFLYRSHGGVLHVAKLIATEKITKKTLDQIAHPFQLSSYALPYDRLIEHIFLAGLGGVTAASLTNSLRWWTPIEEKVLTYSCDEPADQRRAVVLRVTDRVSSVEEFIASVRPFVRNIVANKRQPVRAARKLAANTTNR